MLRGINFHPLLNLCNRFGVIKRDMLQGKRGIQEMDMRICEARQHQPSFSVENLGRAATIFSYLAFTPNRQDLSIANGHSFGPGVFRVDRVNTSMNEDGISRLNSALPKRTRAEAKAKTGEDPESFEHPFTQA